MRASVIIPTFNRREQLRACLSALARSNFDDFEVVVVDDGGTVDLAPLIRQFANVRSIRQKNGGPAAARNRGVEEARGGLVAFTDDDCVPDADWLKTMVAHYDREHEALLGGPVVNLHEDNVFSEASQALCTYLCDFHSRVRGRGSFFMTSNMACDRHAFERLGGFDTSFSIAASEDRDFGMRWWRTGKPMTFVREALVGHAHDLDLRSFLRQHANYGRGAYNLHRVLQARGEKALVLERNGFYDGLILHPFRAGARRPLLQCALLLLSQAATAAGYVEEALTRRRSAPSFSKLMRP